MDPNEHRAGPPGAIYRLPKVDLLEHPPTVPNEKEGLESTEKKIRKDILFSEEVQNEDIYICEKVQRGLKSDGFNQSIFSEKYEIGVSHFQSYISEKINNG